VKVSYRVDIEQEEDGRFLAEVVDLPGVLAYGETAELALAHVQALALRVLADRLDHDEGPRGPVSVSFETSVAA
jgi:predicted RNase H-like HicB family nuclease